MMTLDYVINLIESFMFVFFIFLCCHKNKGIIPLMIATLIKMFIITIQNYYLLPEFLFVVFGLTVLFLYASYINPYKSIQNCFLALTSHMLSISSASIGMIITQLLFGFPFYEGTSYIFLLFSTKAIFLVFVLIVSHYLKSFSFLETKKYIFIFISMINLEFLYSILIDDVFYNEAFGLSHIFSLLTINILSLCFCILLFQFQNEQEYILQLQKDKLLLENEGNIQIVNKENMDNLLRWKHDMKHIFSAIDYNLMNNNITQAREVISKQQDVLNENQFMIYSGNHLIDYLINQRKDIFHAKHIYFSIDYDTSLIPIKDTHFLIILGNLLDNAIENCDNDYQKNIKVTIGTISNYFYIKVENTVKKYILKDNPQLLTTKKDNENHGFGLKNINLLMNQYQGDISFQEKNNYFIVRILFPTTK